MSIGFSILNFISIGLTIYSFIIFARIIMSWFKVQHEGKIFDIIHKITDPYLNLFRRFNFMKFSGFLDISPVFAIITLYILSFIFRELAYRQTISITAILAIIISQIWGIIFILSIIFGLMLIFRLFTTFISDTYSIRSFINTIDMITMSIANRITNKLFKGRLISYKIILGTLSASLLIFALGGNFLIRMLTNFLITL